MTAEPPRTPPTSTTTPSRTAARPGFQLGLSDYERESNTYLQQRLRFIYIVAALGATGFFVLDQIVLLATGGWSPSMLLRPVEILHAASIVIAWSILGLLVRRTYAERALRAFDAAVLYIACGTTLSIWALSYLGPSTATLLSITCTFLVARAVAVPSSASCTFWLSLPVPLGALAIMLLKGASPFAESATDPTYHFGASVVWIEATLFFGVAVAAFASRVTFDLRRQAEQAAQLGQYTLEEKIGEGGMGEVYKATHAMLRRPTAVKVLRPELTGEETLRRFEREVRETSRLSHPNTVAIYDYGRTPDGLFYYAMELLRGRSLKEIVESEGPMPPARAIHILTQACGALQEAHSLGLVHRDIKPGNIMLCERGGETDVAKVVDFGLVKDLRSGDASLTQLGSVCGTPETMAPEVIGGDPAAPASDLYALGIVGYYLLCGKPIFRAKTPGEFIGHHLHTPPVPLSEQAPGAPADLVHVLHSCLEKNPADRPRSAAELKSMLLSCAAAQ